MSDENTSIFCAALHHAHGLEAEAIQIMERRVGELERYPQLADRLRTHLEETRSQKNRLEQILASMNESPSTFKESVKGMMGNLAALARPSAPGEILRSAFTLLAFENYEIAAYRSLIAMGETLGANASLALLRQSLDEERRMAQWIDDNIPTLTLRFLSLRAAGAAPAG